MIKIKNDRLKAKRLAGDESEVIGGYATEASPSSGNTLRGDAAVGVAGSVNVGGPERPGYAAATPSSLAGRQGYAMPSASSLAKGRTRALKPRSVNKKVQCSHGTPCTWFYPVDENVDIWKAGDEEYDTTEWTLPAKATPKARA